MLHFFQKKPFHFRKNETYAQMFSDEMMLLAPVMYYNIPYNVNKKQLVREGAPNIATKCRNKCRTRLVSHIVVFILVC